MCAVFLLPTVTMWQTFHLLVLGKVARLAFLVRAKQKLKEREGGREEGVFKLKCSVGLFKDSDHIEGLVKDLMSMAQECSFSTDIHPLVNTVASRPPGMLTEEELLAINPRYGDIVRNIITLRENYREYTGI